MLAFPANNFNGQEPGTNLEIKSFCRKQKKATFPLFSKISVKGADMHPIYRFLTDKKNAKLGGAVKWNFQKYLVNHEGKVLAKFSPRENPMGAKVTAALDKALAARGAYKKPAGPKKKG